MTERAPRLAVVTQALIAAFAVFLFLTPLATPLGLTFGIATTFVGYLLAHRLAPSRLRLGPGVAAGIAVVLLGNLLSRALGAMSLFDPEVTLWLADALLFGLAGLGTTFALRLLSERVRGFAVVELVAVVGIVGHTFAEHRHERIHQPRVLSDWAWTHGIDPEAVLAGLGVVAVACAALLLLRVRRGMQLLLLLLLLLFFGAIATSLLGTDRLSAASGDDLGLTKKDDDSKKDDKDDSNSNSSSKPPDPVAVALLHDDLPEADVLYFRQAVRSHLVGDRLVEDTSGRFDKDVPTSFPAGAPLEIKTPQQLAVHRKLRTSMFLLVDHAQLFGLAHPTKLTFVQNPNPRRFVAAYDVESLFLTRPIERLIGHEAVSPDWSDEERQHYLELPKDPRYLALSNRLVRDVDPRFVGDDVVKALAIKQYLEKEGYYSLKQKTLNGEDPVANFLFGDLHGYCVHFAHAAVFLLRSQGIAARVALGYGVQTMNRGAGSAVLIYSNEAHAWPEVYLDKVGWVTFDIYPERSDEPPRPHVDPDLASALGELARKDTDPTSDLPKRLVVPWGPLLSTLVLGTLLLLWTIKGARRLIVSSPLRLYRAVLDRLSDLGAAREHGESREHHAARLASVAPSFAPLTWAHLRLTFHSDSPETRSELEVLARKTVDELRRSTPLLKRVQAFINPIGWWFTR